jgi:prepilin-type N-terminal cleavage/methylation domain-containing protein
MKLGKAVAEFKERFNLLAKISGKKDRKREKGFTLIELIAVVIIMGILLVLVVPKILGSSNDADAKLISKSVKDIRDATAMAKLKCLATINSAGCSSDGDDTKDLLPALWGNNCQVMPENAFDIDNAANTAKVKDFTITTDCKNGANKLKVTIKCANNDDICTKVRNQLNTMYGNSTCPTAPTSGTLSCEIPL